MVDINKRNTKIEISDGNKVIISIAVFILGCTVYGLSMDTNMYTLEGLGLGLLASGLVASIVTAIHYYG